MYTDLWSFYRSKEWETFRRTLMLERVDENGDILCAECGKPILRPYDCIGHHVKELTEENVLDCNVALNPDNVVLLHHACHNKVHDRFGWSAGRHIYIVWGSPCAGKEDYVRRVAGPDDLIVSIDRLYKAIGGSRSNRLLGNVMNTYRYLLDMIRTRNGRWRNAWIIRDLPLSVDRERILTEVGGGELIYVDTSKEDCLIEAERRGKEWVGWVEDYWKRFMPPSQ